MQWLEQNLDEGSAELAALALDPPRDRPTCQERLQSALRELGIPIPNRDRAVFVALEFYLSSLAEGSLRPMTAMQAIDELYHIRGTAEFRHPAASADRTVRYAGADLGLEFLYTWYRELQDAEDGSALFYFNEFPKNQQIAKFEEELIREASDLRRHLHRVHPTVAF